MKNFLKEKAVVLKCTDEIFCDPIYVVALMKDSIVMPLFGFIFKDNCFPSKNTNYAASSCFGRSIYIVGGLPFFVQSKKFRFSSARVGLVSMTPTK